LDLGRLLDGGGGVGVASRGGDGRLERGLEEPEYGSTMVWVRFVLNCICMRERNGGREVGVVFHAQRRVCCFGRIYYLVPPSAFRLNVTLILHRND